MSKSTKTATVSTEARAAINSLYHPTRARMIVRLMTEHRLTRGRAVTLSRRAIKRSDRINGTDNWNG